MVNFFKKLFAKKDLIDEQLSCIEGLEKDLQKAQHDLYWIKHNEHKTREESNTAKAINRELVQVMLKNNIFVFNIKLEFNTMIKRGHRNHLYL